MAHASTFRTTGQKVVGSWSGIGPGSARAHWCFRPRRGRGRRGLQRRAHPSTRPGRTPTITSAREDRDAALRPAAAQKGDPICSMVAAAAPERLRATRKPALRKTWPRVPPGLPAVPPTLGQTEAPPPGRPPRPGAEFRRSRAGRARCGLALVRQRRHGVPPGFSVASASSSC